MEEIKCSKEKNNNNNNIFDNKYKNVLLTFAGVPPTNSIRTARRRRMRMNY